MILGILGKQLNILVTGGCGFIGTNIALRMLAAGHKVTVLDSLARAGAERNLAVLSDVSKRFCRFRFLRGDVSNPAAVAAAMADIDVVFHFAAQVSVTASMKDPRADFVANALGTLNILEAARTSKHDPIVVVASTNKVYGPLDHLRHEELKTRWSLPERPYGINETEPLNLITPYACSKGTGDFYVLEYARTFGIRAVIFRQSCIYGRYQHGTEEQAWVAWLIKAALSDRQIMIFGDGKQVRDLLHIDDLAKAYECAINAIDRVTGMVFNIGGGPFNTLSVWCEFGAWLQDVIGRPIPVITKQQRPGDQRVFISDNRMVHDMLGWSPIVKAHDGLDDLLCWLKKAP